MKHNTSLKAKGILVQWNSWIFLPLSEPGNSIGNLWVCQNYELTTDPSYIPPFSYISFAYTQIDVTSASWFFVSKWKHSQSSWKRWSCASLLLFAHRRSGAMAVLDILHPRLALSEGSGCLHSSLAGSELPLQRRSYKQLLGSAYQECVKMWWPMHPSLLCSCLSCTEKLFLNPSVKTK